MAGNGDLLKGNTIDSSVWAKNTQPRRRGGAFEFTTARFYMQGKAPELSSRRGEPPRVCKYKDTKKDPHEGKTERKKKKQKHRKQGHHFLCSGST